MPSAIKPKEAAVAMTLAESWGIVDVVHMNAFMKAVDEGYNDLQLDAQALPTLQEWVQKTLRLNIADPVVRARLLGTLMGNISRLTELP